MGHFIYRKVHDEPIDRDETPILTFFLQFFINF